ncbi:hypothetical protein BT96DRAFT_1011289 [Gymnopus androsaceus JB14]|uniref:Uncharacterized protein n=1 Tax=Gymnopus androsaceus JB14 TaxID=1447944 RepID=A0A6A4IQF3_9AGAR|nr:hypothetical protein BT96DRAFT_1011289 [Gymnopus androsaceus JB14]
MPFRLSKRPTAPTTSADSSEQSVDIQSTRESTKAARRFSQFVQRSKTKILLSFTWIKDIDEQADSARPRRSNEERTRLRSSSVLDLIHPRPSLPTDRISRPIRPGSRSGSRSSQRNPTGRQFSRSEVDLHSPPSRTVAVRAQPPRFGSVVRNRAPQYETFCRPTHSTILSASAIDYSPDTEGLLVINLEDQTTSSIGGLPPIHTPPPAYSLHPGQPCTTTSTGSVA